MELIIYIVVLLLLVLSFIPTKSQRELKHLYKDIDNLIDNCEDYSKFVKSINPLFSRIDIIEFDRGKVENIKARIESKINLLKGK